MDSTHCLAESGRFWRPAPSQRLTLVSASDSGVGSLGHPEVDRVVAGEGAARSAGRPEFRSEMPREIGSGALALSWCCVFPYSRSACSLRSGVARAPLTRRSCPGGRSAPSVPDRPGTFHPHRPMWPLLDQPRAEVDRVGPGATRGPSWRGRSLRMPSNAAPSWHHVEKTPTASANSGT